MRPCDRRLAMPVHVMLLCALVAAGCRGERRSAAAPSPRPASPAPAVTGGATPDRPQHTQPAATAPARRRAAAEIEPELKEVVSELGALFPGPDDWFDARKREAAAPRAITALRRVFALGRELALSPEFGGGPDFSDAEKQYLLAQLVVLGDVEAAAGVQSMVASGDPSRVAHGRAVELLVDWFKAGADAPARERVVTRLDRLAGEYDFWTRGALYAPAAFMAQTTRPGEKKLRAQLTRVWTRRLELEPESLERMFRAGDVRRGERTRR